MAALTRLGMSAKVQNLGGFIASLSLSLPFVRIFFERAASHANL
jgi:hypothetical protein